MSKTFARRAFAVLAIVGCSGLAGCAEERDPINRVQPNALAKSFFVAELDTPDDDPEVDMRVTEIGRAHV